MVEPVGNAVIESDVVAVILGQKVKLFKDIKDTKIRKVCYKDCFL